jgi:hypothetical protein
MRRISRGLVAAMEADEVKKEEKIEPAPAPAPTPAPAEDHAENLETGLIEVNDAETAIDEHDDSVEEAVEVAEALESIAEALTTSVSNGGMDKYSAQVVGIALDHMYRRVGITTAAMPALESFGGTSSRISATQLALEDVQENLKKVWDAIVASIKAAIAWVVDFFSKVWVGAERLKKRAEEVKKRVEAAKGEPKEKEVKSASLVKSLQIEGKAPAKLGDELKEFADLVKSTYSLSSNVAEGFTAASSKVVMDVLVDGFSVPPTKVEPNNLYTKMDDPASIGYEKIDGLKLYRSKEMFGGKAIVAYVNDIELTGQSGIDVAVKISAKISNFDAKAEATKVEVLPVLTLDDAGKVVAAVTEVATATEEYRKERNKVDEAFKKFSGEIEEFAKKASGTDEKNVKEAAASIKKLASAATKIVNSLSVSASSYAVNTGKHLLDYVEQSLKVYSEAPKEEKKEEKPEELPAA